MPKKFCLGCGELTTNGSRCPPCQTKLNKEIETRRGSRHQRGYGSQWAAISKKALADHRAKHGNTCPGWQRPPHPATDLTTDHILPKALGGTDHPQNLQILCRPCNSAKAKATRN